MNAKYPAGQLLQIVPSLMTCPANPPPSSNGSFVAKRPVGQAVQLDAPCPDTEPNPQGAHTVLLKVDVNDDDFPGGHLSQTQLTKQFGAPMGLVQAPNEPAPHALTQYAEEALLPPTVPDMDIPTAKKVPASMYEADPKGASFPEIDELVKETLPPSTLIPPPCCKALFLVKEVLIA
jgi:hypothetical protein